MIATSRVKLRWGSGRVKCKNWTTPLAVSRAGQNTPDERMALPAVSGTARALCGFDPRALLLQIMTALLRVQRAVGQTPFDSATGIKYK
jgi:hypothetical protein